MYATQKREKLVKWLADLNYPKTTKLTCDDCESTNICRFAFDPYNINGDCLGEK